MGEQKRRQQLDPNYGKLRRFNQNLNIPLSIPSQPSKLNIHLQSSFSQVKGGGRTDFRIPIRVDGYEVDEVKDSYLEGVAFLSVDKKGEISVDVIYHCEDKRISPIMKRVIITGISVEAKQEVYHLVATAFKEFLEKSGKPE